MAKEVKHLGYGNARHAATYTVDGVTDTLRGWSERIGCTYHSLYKRICLYGRSPEEAIKAGGNTLNRTRLTVNGKTMHIAEWARETGIDENIISQRIVRGWTAEEAVGLRKHKNPKERLVTHRGKTMRMCEWAKELKIGYETFRQRILRMEAGELSERAAFTRGKLSSWRIVRKVKYQKWYRGKQITVAEIAKRKGCSTTWVNSMLKAGFTASQILDNPAIAPIRDNEEIAKRQRDSANRNKRIRELKKMGLVI